MGLLVILFAFIVFYIGLMFLSAGGWTWIGWIFSFISMDVTDWGWVARSFGSKKSDRGKYVTSGLFLLLLGVALFAFGASNL